MKTTINHNIINNLTILILSILSMNINAQSITPTVIGSGGNSQANSFTIGESFVNTIGADFIITQGFQSKEADLPFVGFDNTECSILDQCRVSSRTSTKEC